MRFRNWMGALVALSLALCGISFGIRNCSPTPSMNNPTAEQVQSPAQSVARQPAVPPALQASTNERGSAMVSRTLPPGRGGLAPGSSGLASAGGLDAGTLHRFDGAGLDEAMRAAMPEVDHCYAEWLKVQPALGGRMKVQFTIASDDGVTGQVSHVSVGDAGTGNVAFEGCVLSVISALRFEPPLNGEMNVTYPLAFIAPPIPPEGLQSELLNLCSTIRSEARRAELANVATDDLLTAVIGSLEEQTPDLKVYFNALLPRDVPPIQRLETFKRAISTAIGAAWVCPEFEALWAGKRI
jgi:hypothetical protein